MIQRHPTSEELAWLVKVQQIPCIICEIYFAITDTPAEVHHLGGQTAPGAHFDSISLCARHHRVKSNHNPQRWISRHGDGRFAFEARYQSEDSLLAHQKNRVKKLESNIVGFEL